MSVTPTSHRTSDRPPRAALLDARGGLIDTLLFANGPDGYRELIAWLVERDAATAIIGIENPAGFGRPLTSALARAGFEVLNVPAWRTHRDRRRIGPGKTDPGDAHAIAQVSAPPRAPHVGVAPNSPVP